MLIVIYLFCGGLSAGAMMLSSVAALFGRSDRDHAIARAGALIAPLPVIAGTGLLVFDLGRPLFFWKLFLAIEPLSPMWIGSWLLVAFSIASLAYAYLYLPLRWQRWSVPSAEAWQRRLALAGLPLGLAVAIYTAILLGVLVARPLWNTPLLSLLFVLSALSTGAAALMLFVPARAHHALSLFDVVVIGGEALALAALLFFGVLSTTSARDGVALLAAGSYAVAFWLGVVGLGLLVPFLIELRLVRRIGHSPLLGAVASILVLTGGFLLRYVIVYVGQLSALG
jgi:formate-dependent nitrite reductase membrane component NrfD